MATQQQAVASSNQQQVQLWDNMAPSYDADLVRQMLLQKFVTFAVQLANIQQEKQYHVLDIGTGTGAIVQQVILLPQVASILATDISSKMLDEVEKKYLKHSKLQTMVLDAQELTSKIAANSMDLVFSQFVHMFVEDKSKAFFELYQVLKPNGGKAIITVIKDNSIANLGMTILLQVLPEWKQQLPGFIAHLPLSLSNPTEAQQVIMQAAPFTSCTCHTAHFADNMSYEHFLQMNAGLLQRVATLYPQAPEAWHKVAQQYNKNGLVEHSLTANVFEIVK